MAQLNSLIVTGDSRFLNTINGNITSANAIHRATMESTSTATAFVLTADGIDSLYDGLIIICKNIKVASASGCTINLNGLGAKGIWVSQGNSACTTHWGLNQTYLFIYDGANSRWELQQGRDTNDNTYDRNRYNCNIKAGATAIVAANIIVADSNGLYHHLKDGTAFDIRYPILYANGAISASGTSTNNYDILHITITTTQSISMTAYLPVYIKGTLSGTTFTPISTTPLTQTAPSTADGYYYIKLGVATAATTLYLQEVHPIYAYKDGKLVEVVNDLSSSSGTITEVKTTAGAHTAIDVTSGVASFNVPTTAAHVGAAASSHTHGNIQNGGTLQTTDVTIASGDKLVVTDSSDSNKVARTSLSFDGSTATKCLTQKGTFESFTNNAGTITSVKTTAGAHTTINVTSGAANFNVPTKTSHLTNDSGFITTDTNNRRAFYGTCSTAGATAAKVVTLSDTTGWELVAGTIVGIRFSNDNTATNVTLNVNSSGAKSIYYKNAVYTGKDGAICGYANHTTYYMYDGTYWAFLSQAVVDSNTDTKVTQTADDSTNSAFEVLMSATADNTTRTETAKKSSKLKFNPSTGNLTASGDIYAGASTGIENSNKLVTGADIYSAGLAPINYSTTEQDTGLTWINGNKIYQITVEFGALPNNNTKDVTCTGMGTNVDEIIEINGIAKAGNTGTFIPLCYAYGGSDANWYKWPIVYFIRNHDSSRYKTIRVTTYTDRSSSTAYFTIKYTKNIN